MAHQAFGFPWTRARVTSDIETPEESHITASAVTRKVKTVSSPTTPKFSGYIIGVEALMRSRRVVLDKFRTRTLRSSEPLVDQY